MKIQTSYLKNVTFRGNVPASSRCWVTPCAASPQFHFDAAGSPDETNQILPKMLTQLWQNIHLAKLQGVDMTAYDLLIIEIRKTWNHCLKMKDL